MDDNTGTVPRAGSDRIFGKIVWHFQALVPSFPMGYYARGLATSTTLWMRLLAKSAVPRRTGKLWSFNSLVVGCRIIKPSPMKAYVYVSLKRSVLDPQGKTIQGALQKLGYNGLQDVRQGKFFELTLDGGLDKSQAESAIGRIAREVLTNPVIEEFRYSIEE